MAKFGMFDSEEERDAWVAWRDRTLAEEAERLKVIGIKDADDLAGKFTLLCNLYETVCHLDGELADDDGEMIPMTSDQARAFATKVFEIMYGGEWRNA